MRARELGSRWKSARSTSEADCPEKLRPHDRVEVSIHGRYYTFVVFQVDDLAVDVTPLRPGPPSRNEGTMQTVVASAPGMGSLRFTWYGGHHRIGHGHGMKFYFKGRPLSHVQLPCCSNPSLRIHCEHVVCDNCNFKALNV